MDEPWANEYEQDLARRKQRMREVLARPITEEDKAALAELLTHYNKEEDE
jgi:hypothetical protein